MDWTWRIIDNRYQLLKRVHSGRRSDIYLASSLEGEERPIALKVLRGDYLSGRIGDRIRFRSELQQVSELSHPNILQIFDIGEVIGLQYIAMEYLEARKLSELIAEGAMPLARCIDIVRKICCALDYIHRAGIVHRDIRPGNILMNDVDVKLTGFGLSHIREIDGASSPEEIGEFFGYLSPEQSGMLGRDIDERSDLYSLGVVLYHLLTGYLPFSGESISSTIHQHLAVVPVSPAEINREVPAMVGRIVLKLLEKEPSKRYQRTGELLDALSRYEKGGTDISDFNERLSGLSYRAKHIGRDEEFGRLLSAFNHSMAGSGSLCLISGEAGIGKTRLVAELRDYATVRGKTFLEGKCFDGYNQTPYSPIRDALHSYAMLYASYPEKRKRTIRKIITDEFRDLGQIIVKLSPAMREVLGDVPPLISIDSERERERFNRVAAHFFHLLGDAEGGMILLIEDIHCSDAGTLNLLSRMREGVSACPLLIIGTHRDDERTGEAFRHFIRAIENDASCSTIHLTALDADQTKRLIADLVSEDDERIAAISRLIFYKSRGNPFFTIEILKLLIAEKVLCSDDGWDVDRDALDEILISPSIMDIIIRRIGHLNREEKRILSAAAVIGERVELELLLALGMLNTNEVMSIVDRGIALKILEADPRNGGAVYFAHNGIREVLYDDLSERKRRELHLSIAEALERRGEDGSDKRVFELVHHFVAGGVRDKIITYAYPAGVKAAENYANEDAIRYFEVGLSLLGGKERVPQEIHLRKIWIQYLEGMGDVFVTVGRIDEAIDLFNRITPFLDSLSDQGRIYNQIGHAYLKKGEWATCEEFVKRGLMLLGEKLPAGRFGLLFSIAKELLIRLLHNLFPDLFMKKFRDEESERFALIVGLYTVLNWSYLMTDVVKLFRSTIRMLNSAERKIGISKELTASLGNYAGLLMAVPLFSRSMKYFKRALALCEELNEELHLAQMLQWMAFCYQWQGEYDLSLDCANRSRDLFVRIGDSWSIGMIEECIGMSYLYKGDFANCVKHVNAYLAISQRIGDSFGTAIAMGILQWCAVEKGELAEAESWGEQSLALGRKEEMLYAICCSSIYYGALETERDEYNAAIQHLNEAKLLCRKNNFIKQYTVKLYSLLAEAALADYLNRIGELSPKEQRALLRRIRGYCKDALRKTRFWQSHRGVALLACARYYSLSGKRKADRYFRRAIEQFRKIGSRYDHARGLYEYGQYRYQMNDPVGARRNLESAYGIFSEIGAKRYIGRLRDLLGIKEEEAESTSIQRSIDRERFALILRLSGEICRIPDLNLMLDEIISRAAELTGAQRGFLFTVSGNSDLTLKAVVDYSISSEGNPREDRFCIEENIDVIQNARSIAETVFREGTSIVPADDDEAEDCSLQSVQVSGSPSILCIPIRGKEHIIGVCYLEHSVSEVFVKKDVLVLMSFFSQIAMSLENALLNEQLKDRAEVKKISITPGTEEKIKQALSYIDENYMDDISREGLAASVGMHHDTLSRLFRIYTGKKIGAYITELRIREAARKLNETEENIIDIAFSVGFESLRTFNRSFLKIMHKTPKRFRDGY